MLRYHARFRSFLLHRLRSEHPEEVPELTARFGLLMADEGYLGEAVDALLTAERRAEAEPLAERAVDQLMRRGDWEKVLAWSAALGDDAHRRRGGLLPGVDLQAWLPVARAPRVDPSARRARSPDGRRL